MGLRTTPVALAALAARAAGSVEGVVAVAPGTPGAATTYGPGTSVAGVGVRPGRGAGSTSTATIHLTLRYGTVIPPTARAVRAAVAPLLDDADPEHAPWTVEVHVVALGAAPGPGGAGGAPA